MTNNYWLSIKKVYLSSAILIGFLLITGIVRQAQSEPLERTEEINGNRELNIIQKIIEFSGNFNKFEHNLGDRTIEPISFRELIEYLPQPPRGWKADEPTGETNSFAGYSVSQAKQTYFQNDRTITVSIFDWAFNSALYTPFLLSTEFSQESTEGYNKGIKIGDIPGRKEYDYRTKNGSLNLLINRRFFLQIDGDNIEETELQKWWQLIDRQSLLKADSN